MKTTTIGAFCIALSTTPLATSAMADCFGCDQYGNSPYMQQQLADQAYQRSNDQFNASQQSAWQEEGASEQATQQAIAAQGAASRAASAALSAQSEAQSAASQQKFENDVRSTESHYFPYAH